MGTTTPAPASTTHEVSIGRIPGHDGEDRHQATCSTCGVLGDWLLHSSAELEREWHLLKHNQRAVTVAFDIEEWTRITQAAAALDFTPVDLIRHRTLRPEPARESA